MFLNILSLIVKNMIMFSGSYSNTVFKDPLSKEEEEKTLNEFFNGDKNARNKLIEHNLRLVAHIVKKYENSKSDVDDLISIGVIGLIKAVDSYKKDKSIKLATYASKCIENEILMHFRTNKKNNKNISIDESIGFDKEGNEITIMEVLKSPKPDFIEDINTKDNIKHLKKYLNILSDREKIIINKRYGLNNEKELTQKEIAKELNISRSYVSRIEKRALTKLLREFIRNKKYNEK